MNSCITLYSWPMVSILSVMVWLYKCFFYKSKCIGLTISLTLYKAVTTKWFNWLLIRPTCMHVSAKWNIGLTPTLRRLQHFLDCWLASASTTYLLLSSTGQLIHFSVYLLSVMLCQSSASRNFCSVCISMITRWCRPKVQHTMTKYTKYGH